jgi:hypothetical protein
VDRVVGLGDVRQDVAMMRTPDRLELTEFHAPAAVSAGLENAPVNTLCIASCLRR